MTNQGSMLSKMLVIGIIILLISISVVSSTGNIVEDITGYYDFLKSGNNPKNMLTCNHVAYIGGPAFETDWLYKFNLNDPFNLTLVCSENGAYPSDSAAWTNEGKIIFISALMYPWLGTIDPETCDWYWILGGGVNCDGLAWNSVNNRLFGTDGLVLYEFDPETGEQTFIGYHSQPVDIILCAIACDGDGLMYGWESFNRRLCTVDMDTGEATVIGELNIAPHFALDGTFCLEDDILYIFAYSTDPNCLYLYECDEDTGSCTLIDQTEENLVSPDLFVIPWNYPPNASSNPNPYNGETGVDLDADLTWANGGDPDGDTLYYDVYFGDNSQPPLVSSNQITNVYNPGTMSLYTTYYWKIVTKDEHDAEAESPIWSFTTRGNNPPNMPNITGPISGKTRTVYSFTFNSVDPNGDDISNYTINWGDGPYEIFEGPFTSGSLVTANHTWTSQRTYTIMAKAKDIYDAESEWAYFNIEIPRTRESIYSWFHLFFDRFPLLEKLLSLIKII